jgi:D-3-phosphoglycerate dehydrogenase
VIVYDPITTMPWNYEPERRVLDRAGVDLIVPEDLAQSRSWLPEVDAVILSGRLPREDLNLLRRCVGICCYSVGMDGVDRTRADELGIAVGNVPGYCTDEVSDHALALLLSLQRAIVPLATAASTGNWEVRDRPEFFAVRRLRGQTVGIIGVGRIGSRVAEKCSGFGMIPIGYDPYRSSGPPGTPLVDLDELLDRADAVIICAAYAPKDHHLISTRELSRLRPHALLVNVARGGFVDERALGEALRGGRLRGAGLDVRDPEPPDAADDPLAGLESVVVTQHVGATSVEAMSDIHLMAAERVLEMLRAAGRLPGSATPAGVSPGG